MPRQGPALASFRRRERRQVNRTGTTLPSNTWPWPLCWKVFAACGSEDLSSSFIVDGPVQDPTRERLRRRLAELRSQRLEVRRPSREQFTGTCGSGGASYTCPFGIPTAGRAIGSWTVPTSTRTFAGLTPREQSAVDGTADDWHMAVCAVPFDSLRPQESQAPPDGHLSSKCDTRPVAVAKPSSIASSESASDRQARSGGASRLRAGSGTPGLVPTRSRVEFSGAWACGAAARQGRLRRR